MIELPLHPIKNVFLHNSNPLMEKNQSRKGYTQKRSDDGNRPARRPYGRRTTDENRQSEPKPRPVRTRTDSAKTAGTKTASSRTGYSKPEQFKGGYKSPKTGSYSKPSTYKKKAKPAVKEDDGLIRLNKFIANSGVCSRREADRLIELGNVTVNGVQVTELGTKIDPAKDDIRFNGERIRGEKKVYILMNKPKNYVTTVSDPHAEQTVMDLISKSKCPERVYPVGRLDKATTGVLLFTNDGALAEKLTHPSHEIKKIYQANLDKNLKRDDMEAILNGITLEDGPIAADAIAYVDEEDKSKIGIEIHSGRNRIVRRIFEHLGYKVKKLDRVFFAGLTKKNVRRGQWRFLTEQEVARLHMGAFE